MQGALKKFDRAIGAIVIILVAAIVVLAAIEVVWLIVRSIISTPAVISIEEVPQLLGTVLLLVVGLELLETMGRYLSGGEMRVDTILMAAMVALARKIIILDVAHLPALTPIGLAALVLALAVAYRLCKADA